MRTRWLALTVVIALAMVWLLSVFGTGGSGIASSSHFGPIPVAPGATRTEGAPIADGFTVARGTALVGDVFPAAIGPDEAFGPATERAWQATLLVDGDPRAVMRAYAEQAERAGFGDAFSRQCSSSSDTFACVGGASVGNEEVRVTVLRSRRGASDRAGVVSHLFMTHASYARPLGPGSSPRGDVAASPPPVPRAWSALAGTGQPVFDAREAPLGAAPPVRVEPGTVVAAPVGWEGRSWSVVLEVSGDPGAAIEAYRRQIVRVGRVEAGPVSSARIAQGTLHRFRTINDGTEAHVYTFELLDGPDGAWLYARGGADD